MGRKKKKNRKYRYCIDLHLIQTKGKRRKERQKGRRIKSSVKIRVAKFKYIFPNLLFFEKSQLEDSWNQEGITMKPGIIQLVFL